MKILAQPAFKNRHQNPYNAALYEAVCAHGGHVSEFSTRAAVAGRFEVIHVHWPDMALHHRSAPRAAAFALYHILRLRAAKERGARIVWTVHNLHCHSAAHPGVERWLWGQFVPLVDGSIHLTKSGRDLALERFPRLAEKPSFVIPHGHYRTCYPNDCGREEARRVLGIPGDAAVAGFIGQIRPYKNIPLLLDAFVSATTLAEADGTRVHLVVAGAHSGDLPLPRTPDGAPPPNITLCLSHIAPEKIQVFLNAVDLVVLPYRDILNSGSAILALSFHRPVLTIDKGAMPELQRLAGADWVCTYDGNLDGATLLGAIRWATRDQRPTSCDLGFLDWNHIARRTLDAYETTLQRSGHSANTTG